MAPVAPPPAAASAFGSCVMIDRLMFTGRSRQQAIAEEPQWSIAHGSLEGVGGLKTNGAYHSKADALLIPEMYFFLENLPTSFFGNVDFMKFVTFSALLALPVMIREGYGQIAHQTLPNILLSNASLVTKSCIARFVEDDAFNPSALSDCSTGPFPSLAYAKSALSSFQANAGCLYGLAYLAVFARFPNKRLIAVGKLERDVKITFLCPHVEDGQWRI